MKYGVRVKTFTNTFTPAKQIASAAISNTAFEYQALTTASTTYTANGLNQYTLVTPTGGAAVSIGYDGNANLTSDGTYSFTYDVENRLVTAATTGMSAAYSYDPMGRRYQKVVTGGTYAGTNVYLSSGDDEIAEYAGNGSTLAKRYIPGPSIDHPIAMIDYTGGTAVTRFFYTDRQGSVVAMSDGAGNLTEGPYRYDAYGKCLSGGTACAGGVPYKYTGRRYDPETGLYYYRARYYSANLGRFLQTDPIGYKDNINWYAYTGNDPMNGTDPSGEITTSWGPAEGHGGGGSGFGDVSIMPDGTPSIGLTGTITRNLKGTVTVVYDGPPAAGTNNAGSSNCPGCYKIAGLPTARGAQDNIPTGIKLIGTSRVGTQGKIQRNRYQLLNRAGQSVHVNGWLQEFAEYVSGTARPQPNPELVEVDDGIIADRFLPPGSDYSGTLTIHQTFTVWINNTPYELKQGFTQAITVSHGYVKVETSTYVKGWW